MNEIWQALAREAAIAAEHMAIGVTALSRANYAQHAYYGQAFFALSIGFERASKLALVVDHALNHGGQFPAHKVLRDYCHRLGDLLDNADKIAERRGLTGTESRLPRSNIHDGIVGVLSDFASNLTRYYNLALVTGDPKAEHIVDPGRAWFERVTVPVLNAHYRRRERQRHESKATQIAELLNGIATVRFHSERGDELTSAYDASLLTGMTRFAIPYTRMYVMQIARFLGGLLSTLGYAGYQLGSPIIPHLSEFFAIFNNTDDYFRQRKRWSIYPGTS